MKAPWMRTAAVEGFFFALRRPMIGRRGAVRVGPAVSVRPVFQRRSHYQCAGVGPTESDPQIQGGTTMLVLSRRVGESIVIDDNIFRVGISMLNCKRDSLLCYLCP